MSLRSLLRSVVEWIRPARRVQPEPRITAEQLRDALRDMLDDPEIRRLLLRNLVGSVFPIAGGACTINPADITPGAFGSSTDCPTATEFSFPRKLGIGTAGPAQKLEVSGSNAGSEIALRITNSAQAANDVTKLEFAEGGSFPIRGRIYTKIRSGGNSDIFFGTANTGGTVVTDQMVLTSEGTVGIGTTTPGAKLSLGLDLANTKLALYDVGGDQYGLGIQAGQFRLHVGNSTADFLFLNAAAGAEILRIKGNGNVGIGTTAPTEKLEIAGSAYINAEGAGFLWDAAGLKRAGLIKQSGFNPEIRYLSSIGLGIRRVTAGTLVAPTASDLPLLFESDGNVRTGKLNKIVFLRPLGGGQNDSPQINAAIAALPPEGGIIVLLADPNNVPYTLGSKILIEKDGVKLRGYGGNRTDAPPHLDRFRTKLQWSPALATQNDQPIIELKSPVNPGPPPFVEYIQDLEVSDLTIDGAGGDAVDPKAAAIGLLLDHVQNSVFRNVHIRNMKKRKTDPPVQIGGVGIKIKGEIAGSCDWNVFENCSATNVSQGIVLEGVGPAHNTFIAPTAFVWGSHAEDVGIWLKECDNCRFYGAQTGLLPGTLGNGVVIENPQFARANYFYHLQAGGGLRVKNAGPLPSSKNLIFGYDRENGEPPPVSEPDPDAAKFLFWIDSNGSIRGGS